MARPAALVRKFLTVRRGVAGSTVRKRPGAEEDRIGRPFLPRPLVAPYAFDCSMFACQGELCLRVVETCQRPGIRVVTRLAIDAY